MVVRRSHGSTCIRVLSRQREWVKEVGPARMDVRQQKFSPLQTTYPEVAHWGFGDLHWGLSAESR